MQTVSVDQLVGKTLGDYQVQRVLGKGKLSAVYMAQQRSLNRTVMITTFILPETLSARARERFNARFLQEGASLVRLNHPHVLPIYDFGVQFGFPYLVTDILRQGRFACASYQATAALYPPTRVGDGAADSSGPRPCA